MARWRRSAPISATAWRSTKSSSNSPEAPVIEAIRFRIQGRVQGVGYRAWLEGEALAHGLRGWARNQRDGSVETLLIGPSDAAEAPIAARPHRPPPAQVTPVA